MINKLELDVLEKSYANQIIEIAQGIGRQTDYTIDWGYIEKKIGKMQAIIKRREKLRLDFEHSQERE